MSLAVPRLAGLSLTRTKKVSVALAATPRANLLPPSVLAAQRARRTLRLILLAVVGSVALVAVAVGAATFAASTSGSALEAERSKTDALLAKQSEYSDVSAGLAAIDSIRAQEAIAGAADVEWTRYLALVTAALPQGMTLDATQVEATSPLAQVTQSTAPLQGARVATLTLTVGMTDLRQLETWLTELTTLPGFVDATPQAVTGTDGGVLTATVVLNVDEGAYSGRFATQQGAGK